MQKKNDQKCDHKNRFYSALLSQGGTAGLLHGGEGASQRKALSVYQRFTSGASLRGYRHAERETKLQGGSFLLPLKIITYK